MSYNWQHFIIVETGYHFIYCFLNVLKSPFNIELTNNRKS